MPPSSSAGVGFSLLFFTGLWHFNGICLISHMIFGTWCLSEMKGCVQRTQSVSGNSLKFVSVASFNIKANRTSCFKIFDKLNIYWSFEWCLSSFKTYFSLLVNAKWVFSTAYVWGASPCLNLDSNVLIQTVRGTNRWMDESVSVPVCLFALEMENKLR